MNDLDRRPGKISNVNVRVELHGEEPVPAMDISMVGVLFKKPEANDFHNDPTWWDRQFNEKGQLAEPADRDYKPRHIDRKYENATVRLYVGINLELIELEEVKLVKFVEDLQVGGLTEIRFTIQTTPDMDEVAAPLINWMGHDVAVEIEFGDIEKPEAKQPSLDLDHSHVGSPDQERAKAKTREAGITVGMESGESAAA